MKHTQTTISPTRLSLNNLGFIGLLFVGLIQTLAAAENPLPVLQLPSLQGWEEKSFSGNTHYEVVQLDGNPALMASSNKTASGLFYKAGIDLTQTPYLNWSWRVTNVLHDINETQKDGDDYPARIYVVISGGLMFWRTRALNYVWSSNQAIGAVWPNAFTGNATLVAVRNDTSPMNTWITEKRNLREDIKRYLNIDVDHIDAVAIMTDTDNSGQSATAYYRDIFFTNH